MDLERRFTFDDVADLYDRYRPRYPEALFDDLASLSGLTRGDRILEIGSGTGQATCSLAKRGFSILCLEPGRALGELARRNLVEFPHVEILPTTFEAWTLDPGAFDLVVSAQAFHWVPPEVRFTKSAAALRADGALAIIGNTVDPDPSPLRTSLDAAYALHAPGLPGKPSMGFYSREGPISALFDDSNCFGPVTRRQYPWAKTYKVEEYEGLLQTHSDHRILPPDQREPLLDAVRDAIRHHGGSIEIRYTANLYWASRKA